MEDARTGTAERVGPLVRRVLAPNPSPFTFTGTQTYIVGSGEVAVIDPGPDIPAHVEALLAALEGERVAAILCTHTHRDHSPASRALKAATEAPIGGCAPLAIEDEGPRSDESFDADYRPDFVLADGEGLSGPGWTLRAVATPGHTSNHLCLALAEEEALFSGDHVMGWSTTVVAPPDGDMAAYMASLEMLRARYDRIYYPAHGPALERPRARIEELLDHRRGREAQILRGLEGGGAAIPRLVADIYRDLDPRLHAAAGMSVLAHLVDLQQRGLARKEGNRWQLTGRA